MVNQEKIVTYELLGIFIRGILSQGGWEWGVS